MCVGIVCVCVNLRPTGRATAVPRLTGTHGQSVCVCLRRRRTRVGAGPRRFHAWHASWNLGRRPTFTAAFTPSVSAPARPHNVFEAS